MKLTVLGSAAAEGVPALWCECETCRIAVERGGRDLRRRTCYLLDSDTLIDFGPDAYWQCSEFKVDLPNLKRILFTHPHHDHLDGVELLWRRAGFSKVTKPLTVVGRPTIFSEILSCGASGAVYKLETLHIVPLEAKPGEWQKDGDLAFLSIEANHAPGRMPVIYVLRRNGRTLLIANDTGYLSEDSWKKLEGVKLDAAIIECTMGMAHPDSRNGHMGSNVSIEFRKRLVDMGCLASDAPAIVNHFTHNCGGNHADLVKLFQPAEIEVAYDGMVLEI